MSKGNVVLPTDILRAVSKMTLIIGEEFTSSTGDGCHWQGPNDDWIVSLSWGGEKFKISIHGFENPLDDKIMYALVGYAAYRGWEWNAP